MIQYVSVYSPAKFSRPGIPSLLKSKDLTPSGLDPIGPPTCYSAHGDPPNPQGHTGKTMAFMFENLEVYRRALDLAERIDGLTEVFPAKHDHLVDQLGRASMSISLNIAERNGRWHAKERKNFFWIARGSVFECVPLLELCKRKKLITEENCGRLKGELEILAKMLSALIKGTEKRRQ